MIDPPPSEGPFPGIARAARAISLPALALLLALLPAACGRSAPSEGEGEGADGTTAKSAERRCRELLGDGSQIAPAKEWLAPGPVPHVLWKGDREAIQRLVADLEQAGAPAVHVVGIYREAEGELAAMFAATLPPKGPVRDRLFQLQRSFWRSYLGDASEEDLEEILEPDLGQSCLVFNFDL